MAKTASARKSPSDHKRHQTVHSDSVRLRALDRLYERMATVDELIHSLERYQRASQPAESLEFSAAAKWS